MTDDNVHKVPDGAAPTQAAGKGVIQAPGSGVSDILSRWKREDLLTRSSLVLHGLALIFSVIAFIVMASNVIGKILIDMKNTGLQVLRQIHELSTGKESFSRQRLALVVFVGDQVVAYMLLSAAVPLTNRMRENNDNIFTDSSVAAISMEFLAFIALAVSAPISGHKLSNQTYI